jgi:hypothetical protein
MSINRRMLALLGARYPAIYDLIPRSPVGVVVQGQLSELSPQPLPPLELGAALAAEFAQTAWQAERSGLDPARVFRDPEDWCPTPPRTPKLPPRWKLPPEPQPRPEWYLDLHIGFAAGLAWSTDGIDNPALRDVFDTALKHAMGVIESATP